MGLLRKDRKFDSSPSTSKAKPFLQAKDSPIDPFFKPAIQTKLKIGKSNDKFEQEADRVADRVVSKSKGDAIQKKGGDEEIQQKPIASEVTPLVQKSEASEEEPVQKSAAEEEKVQKQEEEEAVQTKGESEEESVQMMEEEEAVQTKSEEEESVQMQEEEEAVQTKGEEEESVQKQEEEEAVQAKGEEEESVQMQEEEEAVQTKLQSNGSKGKSSSIESRLNSSKGGGQKLSGKAKHEMESGFGSDFSNVNIHTDQNAAQLSKDLGAKAFAHGNDIYFNKGQFNPESSEGKHLLAHELTHTIQQKGMVQKKCDSCEASERENQSGMGLVQKKELVQRKKQAPAYEVQRTAGPSSASIGTIVSYNVKANYGGKVLSRYSYRWKVIDAAGRTFYTQTTNSPYTSLQAKVPGDYIIQAQILDGDQWVDQAMIKQNVYFEEKNTELGGLSVGNFDFKYDGNTASVEVRLKFGFESGISKTDQKDFKKKFFDGVKMYWSKSQVSFKGNGFCANDNVPFNINVKENATNYHKLVDVEKSHRRPNVISDMNVYLGISKKTIAHEFGHVLGLYDEYDGGAFENAMFWHDDGSNQKDTDALMNTGTELRNRYFTSFLDHVNENAPKKCKYSLKTPFKK